MSKTGLRVRRCWQLALLCAVSIAAAVGVVRTSATGSARAAMAQTPPPQVTQGEFVSLPTFPATAPVMIHASVLPDGKVLFWGRDKEGEDVNNPTMNDVVGKSKARVWDPVTGAFEVVDNQTTNLFCTGHSLLPDGRLFATGGHNHFHPNSRVGDRHTNIFDPVTRSWVSDPAPPLMQLGRWYPFNLTLDTGEVAILSGTYAVDDATPPAVEVQKTPEIYNPKTNTLEAMTPSEFALPTYPLVFLDSQTGVDSAGNPRGVFIAGPRNSYLWNPRGGADGKGLWATLNGWGNTLFQDASAVMYDSENGGVLLVGGRNSLKEALTTARKITLNQSNPQWVSAGNMASPRSWHTTTLLPDGKVLVTGGTPCITGQLKDPCYRREPTTTGDYSTYDINITNTAEMWNPATGLWSQLATASKVRGYHSVALLLPDATVLVGGYGNPDGLDKSQGDADPYATPTPAFDPYLTLRRHKTGERNVEIYKPPYLFDSMGNPAQRPVIDSAPAEVSYGTRYSLTYSNAAGIDKVTWVRLPSVTHGFNQDQRIVVFEGDKLTVNPSSPNQLLVKAPTDPRKCPPGYYMMFALSGGVPSKAKIVRISNDQPSVSSRVARNTDGRLEVFYKGSANPFSLYHIVQTTTGLNAQWGQPESLGGGLASDPVSVANLDGRLQVFIRGTDNQLWTKSQTTPGGSTWSAWTAVPNLGPPPSAGATPPPVAGVAAEPVAVRNIDGRLQIFVRGADNFLRYTVQKAPNVNEFDYYRDLGGVGLIMPHVGVNKDGRVQFFTLSTDYRVWYRSQLIPGNPHLWADWGVLPSVSTAGTFTGSSAPEVTRSEDGRLVVFERGADNYLYYTWQIAPDDSSNWVGTWQQTGLQITNRPSVKLDGDGRMQMFARATSNVVRYRRELWPNATGLLSSPASLNGITADTPPTVIRNSDGRLEVFVRAGGSQIYHNWQLSPAGDTWAGWVSLGGSAGNF